MRKDDLGNTIRASMQAGVQMKSTLPEAESFSYVMMFCALMLVKSSKATMGEAMALVPLDGRARLLAEELAAA
jgi:hypothetical protein